MREPGWGRAAGPQGANTQRGQSARPCRSARPRGDHGVGRRTRSGFESAVEFRLGEKRARQLQNLIGLAQCLDLAFQGLEPLAFLSRHAIARAGIDLVLAHPVMPRLRNAADLRGYRLDGGPQRGILATVLLHHTHRAFARFRAGSPAPRASERACTIRTARSRTSGEYFGVGFLPCMASFSQESKPPQNPGRFRSW